jgi:hypothetical protein
MRQLEADVTKSATCRMKHIEAGGQQFSARLFSLSAEPGLIATD